uniref:DNA-directed DNA polymerase family A palm domain-containing protein n=1 Tax=Pygocentrus nattereri TaxID=42514 RepID=A0A3B4ECC7_PYGNA
MESPSCSTLTAGPLSLAAQTVMAALRAQYAGRIHRTRHSELGTAEKGRRFYNHSPEMELPSQPAISLFQSKDNTFSEWETDEPGSLKLRDYGLDGSLLALNDNKITVSGNHILKIHTQSEEPFPMKDFSDWEDPQAVPDAIVVPEKQREISRTKKNIRLMCLSEDVFKAERVTRAPPRKRWSFSHLQMPAMSCSKDFIEEQKSDFGRQNREGSSKKMEADCFEGKMETVEGVMTMPKQRKDQEVGMSEKIQLNGLWSEGPDKESVVYTKTTNHSYISEFPKQKRSASEIDNQIHPEHPEGVKERYAISASSRLTLALPSDARVCDTSRLSQEERVCVLEEASRARALVVSMVYQDGTTQLDPEQKPLPAVCGLLVLLKKSLESLDLDQTGAAKERVLLLRLEQRPVWVQQDSQHNQDLFTREILLQMVCGMQSLVCYKSKDLLRTILRHFSRDLSWKQVAACQVLDPQIAAWLLDPADSAHCFQDLLSKHCSLPATHTPAQPALGHSKVRTHANTHTLQQHKQEGQKTVTPVLSLSLSAMESHSIHVDKENLKKTSDMLGNKLKQLEQEAHQAAGQQFLVSSSAQLRLVLFEKLRLHERCENKKLPKTVFKQQQSTSEAALLQLQDLHPLPKIILEHRQVKYPLSLSLSQSFISSTWNQTSTVSGRLSAKHPNFQALPKLPVQITKKQYIQGKEEEFVTVHPRSMFIPQEGWTFLSADFCQVELRLLAHLSSDPELLRIFQNPEADVFTMLASQWWGINEDSVSSEDRDHAKRIVYSVVYGAGKKRLSGILRVSLEEASHFQDSFLQTYKEVQNFIQHTVQHCHKYGYVKSIMGRRRFLPHVHSTDWGVRNQAERQAVNFVVLVAQIHDELLFEVEDSQVEDFAVLVKEIMESLEHIDCLGVSLNVTSWV